MCGDDIMLDNGSAQEFRQCRATISDKSPTGNKLEVLTVIAVICCSKSVYYSLFL